jgi:hypothetical protein
MTRYTVLNEEWMLKPFSEGFVLRFPRSLDSAQNSTAQHSTAKDKTRQDKTRQDKDTNDPEFCC